MPLPDSTAALALLKPSVRAEVAYTLEAPVVARKLNQNEAALDVPEDLKREILVRAAALPWHRYPAFAPAHLSAAIAERHGWVADGVLVGNGSNEVIQAALSVSVAEGAVVVASAAVTCRCPLARTSATTWMPSWRRRIGSGPV
jgi:histidinol-phosphate aminotransferase